MKEHKGAQIELNVYGDTMRLGSPSARGILESNPFMQEKLLAMKGEIDMLLSQIGGPVSSETDN